MPDFLLELRSEEIPARMQAGARAELEKLFRREMEAAALRQAQGERLEITVWSTPRRLALIARDLPESTQAVSEEAKGPPEGAPDAAIDGFCRKNGVTRDQLELRDVKGRNTWFAVIEKPGRATRDLLAEAIPAIVRDLAWPKSMRWGAASISTESPRWVRPLSGIVAILGEELVECEAAGVASGYATHGHRFHCPGEITIGGAHDYAEKLRACHVIVDHEERAALIRAGAAKAAAEAGLTLVEDEGLVVENAGLTEWPVPLLGRFDEAFLDVPPEVIQLTARTNQKYFVCVNPSPLQGRGRSPEGAEGVGDVPHVSATPHSPTLSPEGEREILTNAFVCTANIAAADGGAAIVDGNRKVLAARLADARFFWEQDRKTPLAEHAKKLERITFHEKLGTVADKVERVAKLARWLVEEGIVNPPRLGEGDHAQHGGGAPSTAQDSSPSEPPPVPLHPRASLGGPPPPVGEDLADLAEQAARLCKADLVTEMVGEFPELQGLMGGYYARAEGLPHEVADAIRDHYKPVGQGDEVPTAPVTVAVSLADKVDTLVGFFAIGEQPTGSKDPYALRRAAISIIRLIHENGIRANIDTLTSLAAIELVPKISSVRVASLVRRDFQAFGRASLIKKLDNEEYLNGLRAETEDADHIVTLHRDLYSVLPFLADRLKVQQREAGVRHDLIDAVFACPKPEGGNEDDLVRLLARVNALQSFMETEDGANLLAGYKRAANILRKEDWPTKPSPLQGRGRSAEGAEGVGDASAASPASHHPPAPSSEEEGEIPQTGEEDPLANVDDPDLAAVIDAKMADAHAKELSYTPEPAEKALMDALDSAEPAAARAIAAEDFAAAMAALASLRAPIDRFFEEVTVNADEENKRAHRLDLLARFRAAVHEVADFSRIEG